MEQGQSNEPRDGKDRRSESPNKDDSLTDFKSPKAQLTAPTISGKTKVVKDKRTKKSSAKGTKASSSDKKKQASMSSVRAQPSIESSFFKSTNNAQREGHTCPLCMKYFDDTCTGTAHTKSCAVKNKVSTSKLLAAVALQQRQTDERLAIGLPAGPVSRAKDNNSKRFRQPTLKNDPDLQLALALSKSLEENQADRELEEALLLAAEHRGDAPVEGMTDSQRRRTLKNFGFSTNKPVASETAPTKPRRSEYKEKHLGPTILQTRTQESRNRLLSDKIAEILMGNEAITQVAQRESLSEFSCIKKSAVAPKSRLLNEIYQTTKRLWDSAGLSSGVTNFYVQDLVEFVSSSSSSQPLPPLRSDGQEQNLATPENNEAGCQHVSGQRRIEPNNQRISNEFLIGTDNQVPEEMLHSSNNREYRNTLPMDWANTLNVSTMSDVVVLVENNHIWAHRLVLYVRCSNILLDCQPMDDQKFRHVKEKIDWPDIDYLTALAFLEFVYSGVIVKTECVFEDNRSVSSIGNLARKYRMKDLFDYMRKRNSQVDKPTEGSEERKSRFKSPIIIQVADQTREVEKVSDNSANTPVATVNSTEELEALIVHKSNIFHPTPEETSEYSSVATNENISQISDMKPIENVSDVSFLRCRSISPDLFDDTSEELMEDATTNDSEVIEATSRESNGDNSNLKILAQLISDDNLSPSAESDKSETSIISASTIVDESRSHESPTIGTQDRWKTSRTHNTCSGTSQHSDRARRISKKPKSNLSIFIEKVQKINAKSALDSYTEEDSLGVSYVCANRRNPFGINNESDKSIFNATHEADVDDEQRVNPKGALTALEEQLLLLNEKKENRIAPIFENTAVNMNEPSLIEPPSELDDSSILDTTIESADYENMSIYSRYKKTHEHNSVKEYRNSLIKLTEASTAETSRDDDKNDHSSPLNEEAIDLTQESDTEVESSPASSVVRFDRSRANNRPLVISDSDSILSGEQNERQEKIFVRSSQSELATLQDHSIDITSPAANLSNNLSTSPEYPESCPRQADKNISSQSLTNSKTFNSSPRYSDGIEKSVFGRRKRSFDEFTAGDSSFFTDLEKEQMSHSSNGDGSSKGTKSLTHSSLYPELDVFQVDDRIFTQSFVSPQSSRRTSPSPSLPNSKPNGSHRKRRANDSKAKEANCVHISQEDNEKQLAESPRISPHSACDNDVFQHDDFVFTQSFKSPRVSPFRTLTTTTSYENNKKDSDKNESLRVSSPILISSSPDMDTVDTDGCMTEIQDFNKENMCLVTEVNSGPSLSPRNSPSFSNLEIPPSPKAGPSRQRFSPDCTKITPRTSKNSLVRWNSMPTETSNTRSGLKRNRTPTKSSRLVLSQNLTAPVNYDTMDTPELKLELDKYGIKPQKAHRARQLLTHIYNELCTQVPSTDSDAAHSSDADEPPIKKIGRNDDHTSDDSEPESVTGAVSIIPEEMESLDADVQLSDGDDSSNKITIKQAFTDLIKDDKELHNKLLTYEPLSFELLYVMLTARGFKCKVNDLMDFLDQECITFQMKDQARRHKGVKARAKKTIGTKNPSIPKS